MVIDNMISLMTPDCCGDITSYLFLVYGENFVATVSRTEPTFSGADIWECTSFLKLDDVDHKKSFISSNNATEEDRKLLFNVAVSAKIYYGTNKDGIS